MRFGIFAALGVAALFTLSCADSVTENRPAQDPVPFAYPAGPDRYESDGTRETAGLMEVGVPQWRSIYPVGDEDWVRVGLEAGIEYEFTASHLSVNGDTWLYLYGADGATVLADNDDCVGYDSCFRFTPSSDSVYYLRVDAYANQGLMSYRLEARPFTDADGDGWSPFHDCDDQDFDIYPTAMDEAGDGVDRNCTGTDAPDASVPDDSETDDTAETATAMVVPLGMQYEFIRRGEFFPEGMHTIHDLTDVDWFTVELQPRCMVAIEEEDEGGNWPFFEISLGPVEVEVTNEDLRAFSPWEGYTFVANDSDVPRKALIRVVGAPYLHFPVSYLVYATPQGFDRDMDGYGTMGMWGEHDCDDTDPEVNDGAIDTAGDGIDQDCDGVDGAAPRVMLRDGFENKRRK